MIIKFLQEYYLVEFLKISFDITKIGCIFGCNFKYLHQKMISIKRNITFAPEIRKKAGVPIVENAPIRMRVTYGCKRIEFTTGYRIDTAKWDSDRQCVRKGCTNKLKQSAAEINASLQRYATIIQEIFKEYEVKDELPTVDVLKEEFNSRTGSKAPDNEMERTLLMIFDEFVCECGKQNDWTDSTYEKFTSVKNHIIEFNSKPTFNNFNERGLNDYVDFLRNKKDMRNSTIEKQLGFIKWFLRWSLKKGYNDCTDFESFRAKLKKTSKKVIFLTPDELRQLQTFEIPQSKQYLERVRDVFLFCCFSGLRYSDVYNLKKSDVKNDHIEITTVKTADSLVIELNDQTQSIIQKYKNVHFEGGKVLPVISNQKMNEYLKELCELAQINELIRETHYKGNQRIDLVTPKYELIGTHCGRRTFICNALALGIPVQVVMKWTGHSDYKAMKPYIDIADSFKAESMTRFNTLASHD